MAFNKLERQEEVQSMKLGLLLLGWSAVLRARYFMPLNNYNLLSLTSSENSFQFLSPEANHF